MDRKAPETQPDSQVDTPETLRAVGEHYIDRLRAQVDGLVTAFERVAAPDTNLEVGRRAQALRTLRKAIVELFGMDKKEDDEMHGNRNGQPDAVDAWRHIVERKLAKAAEERRAGRGPRDVDADAKALSRQLGRAAARARAAGD